MGSPIALRIGNTEWPQWVEVMSPEPVDLTDAVPRAAAPRSPARAPATPTSSACRSTASTRPAPILERASARETAARVALGAVARAFLGELGIRLVSHTLSIGPVRVPEGAALPTPDDVDALDADPLRCFDAATSARMVAEVDARARGRRHPRRHRRGARLRPSAGTRLARALGSPARRASSPAR